MGTLERVGHQSLFYSPSERPTAVDASAQGAQLSSSFALHHLHAFREVSLADDTTRKLHYLREGSPART